MPYKDKAKRNAAIRRYADRMKCEEPERFERWAENRRNAVRRVKKNDPRYSLLTSAKERAAKFNLPINITLDDIIIPECCPVFPTMMLYRNKGFGGEDSPTLDRIVPAKGYTKGNVQVISFKANRLKSNASIEELEMVVEYMRRFENREDE